MIASVNRRLGAATTGRVGAQEHSSDQSSGSFDCKNCKTNVLKSSGVYDYSRWTPVPK